MGGFYSPNPQAESDRQFFRNEVTGIRREVKRIVEHLFGQSPDREQRLANGYILSKLPAKSLINPH
ncbi:MAG: hypothetical protein EWV76_03230 [Microcystis novacekii Mn_MB_F_20050700_S1]|uniref:Uncharacterized protein n=1 Tax=Microcystis novacekii Mn_MB_F_20050700_S1D TaxID=2486266 RepID=A0A552J5V6_9CHRO|nr:MAG: hypothetical protein EWV54_05535 [Microcystis novacekii Mn_MB_F_20050700_S1D]TRU91901.1 MAG: hypothetical protein EWV76_03230 [Microcystis novacekii Mn_MB_F_20050700_S1]